MTQVSELSKNPTQMVGALRDSLETLDLNTEVTFQIYSRTVLPLDGYIFWTPLKKCVFKGSLHYSREMLQNEDETYGLATVTFTSESEIAEFTREPLNRLYVARVGTFRYAFSQQQGFYKTANLWHYFGHSVQPALEAQLLDEPGMIDSSQPVVSNSLPFWLQLNSYAAPYWDGFANTANPVTTTVVNGTGVTLYPSFCVPPNITPAYGVVHIGAEDTRAIQAVPLIDANRNHYQLAADRVRVTLYGLQNNAACDFLDCVLQYSVDTGNFGIMNTPIIRDGKRTQVEMMALAQQKFIDIEASYYQTRANDIARQLIKQAQATILLGSAS
jgi:hypothetical protein